jgi:tetratricopeptide (TPR) repeat protein
VVAVVLAVWLSGDRDSAASPAPAPAPPTVTDAAAPAVRAATPVVVPAAAIEARPVEVAPQAPSGVTLPETSPAAELRKATALVKRGRYLGAVKLLWEIVAAEPENAAARFRLGQALYESGQEALALPHLEKARALKSAPAEVHVLLGAVYQGRNERKKTRLAYEAYLKKSPRGKYADELRSILGTR